MAGVPTSAWPDVPFDQRIRQATHYKFLLLNRDVVREHLRLQDGTVHTDYHLLRLLDSIEPRLEPAQLPTYDLRIRHVARYRAYCLCQLGVSAFPIDPIKVSLFIGEVVMTDVKTDKPLGEAQKDVMNEAEKIVEGLEWARSLLVGFFVDAGFWEIGTIPLQDHPAIKTLSTSPLYSYIADDGSGCVAADTSDQLFWNQKLPVPTASTPLLHDPGTRSDLARRALWLSHLDRYLVANPCPRIPQSRWVYWRCPPYYFPKNFIPGYHEDRRHTDQRPFPSSCFGILTRYTYSPLFVVGAKVGMAGDEGVMNEMAPIKKMATVDAKKLNWWGARMVQAPDADANLDPDHVASVIAEATKGVAEVLVPRLGTTHDASTFTTMMPTPRDLKPARAEMFPDCWRDLQSTPISYQCRSNTAWFQSPTHPVASAFWLRGVNQYLDGFFGGLRQAGLDIQTRCPTVFRLRPPVPKNKRTVEETVSEGETIEGEETKKAPKVEVTAPSAGPSSMQVETARAPTVRFAVPTMPVPQSSTDVEPRAADHVAPTSARVIIPLRSGRTASSGLLQSTLSSLGRTESAVSLAPTETDDTPKATAAEAEAASARIDALLDARKPKVYDPTWADLLISWEGITPAERAAAQAEEARAPVEEASSRPTIDFDLNLATHHDTLVRFSGLAKEKIRRDNGTIALSQCEAELCELLNPGTRSLETFERYRNWCSFHTLPCVPIEPLRVILFLASRADRTNEDQRGDEIGDLEAARQRTAYLFKYGGFSPNIRQPLWLHTAMRSLSPHRVERQRAIHCVVTGNRPAVSDEDGLNVDRSDARSHWTEVARSQRLPLRRPGEPPSSGRPAAGASSVATFVPGGEQLTIPPPPPPPVYYTSRRASVTVMGETYHPSRQANVIIAAPRRSDLGPSSDPDAPIPIPNRAAIEEAFAARAAADIPEPLVPPSPPTVRATLLETGRSGSGASPGSGERRRGASEVTQFGGLPFATSSATILYQEVDSDGDPFDSSGWKSKSVDIRGSVLGNLMFPGCPPGTPEGQERWMLEYRRRSRDDGADEWMLNAQDWRVFALLSKREHAFKAMRQDQDGSIVNSTIEKMLSEFIDRKSDPSEHEFLERVLGSYRTWCRLREVPAWPLEPARATIFLIESIDEDKCTEIRKEMVIDVLEMFRRVTAPVFKFGSFWPWGQDSLWHARIVRTMVVAAPMIPPPVRDATYDPFPDVCPDQRMAWTAAVRRDELPLTTPTARKSRAAIDAGWAGEDTLSKLISDGHLTALLRAPGNFDTRPIHPNAFTDQTIYRLGMSRLQMATKRNRLPRRSSATPSDLGKIWKLLEPY